MNGWPLPPHLLAALQNADARTLKRAEIALMNTLGFDLEVVSPPPTSETTPRHA